MIELALAFRVLPWELEEQISSAWITKLQAFKNEFTLDPAGSRSAANVARVIAVANGGADVSIDDFIERTEWVTQEELAERHLKLALAAWPDETIKQ